MNSLIIIIVGGGLFWMGYRFYARKLEELWEISDRPTPAVSKYNGIDFVPAKNWLVLFGHHFASIAGAAPIIGPIIALSIWGWGAAVIWIVLGTIFIGAVHDFGSLITSVREGGSSIAEIANSVISKRAKIFLATFIWLTLILIIAVFVHLCAKTFVNEPRIVMPSLGLIPISILIGFLMYNLRLNTFFITILGIGLLTALIFLGNTYPIVLGQHGLLIWSFVLIVYAYFASIIPVNILLQPRDYLSSFLLFAGLAIGYISLIIYHPKINLPVYTSWSPKDKMLWPMLCVTVACGAISGFHSLIASGTTSKQLPREGMAKGIGYGGMVAEGLVALMAILVVSAGILNKENLTSAIKEIGPIGVFGRGYGNVTDGILRGFGAFVAITILNAFILTTLDTATRIGRYITEELFNIKNRFLSTFIVVFFGAALALSGKWEKIWPAFGAANQLVAALALLTLTCWLLSKNKLIRFTLTPAIFMFATTTAALFIQIINYIKEKDYILLVVSTALIFLAIFMMKESINVLMRIRRKLVA